jgi:ferredoxin
VTYIPKIDEAGCIGQGDCAEIAPDVFEVGDCARVTGTGPDALLMEAALNCPTEAIVLVDAASGEQVYP